MYKEDQTNIDKMLDDFNIAIPNMKFTLEKEENIKINFLDITIAKGHDSLLFEICSKSTTTDVIIPNDSCHPGEHKTAAIRFYNGMKSYKLTPEGQQKERNTVQQILANNNYKASTLNKIRKEKKKKRDTQKRKWAKFTYMYIGKETRFITKQF
jgi:hypothetical protein